MNYNFNRASYGSDGVVDTRTFNEMMNFVHSFNDVKSSGVTDAATIVNTLRENGMANAAAMYTMVLRVCGGNVPSIEQENEFMGAYANYTYEKIAESRANVEALKAEYNNGERFTDGNGKTYSAKSLKAAGQKAKKQVTKSKWARFGLIALGAIALSLIIPGLISGLFVGMVATSTLSTLTAIGGIAGLIGGGILGKRLYDAGGRKEKLANNIALRDLYEQNKEYIAEQELEMQRAMAREYELEDAFGIELDANGNEISNAYEDIYTRFARESAASNEGENESTNEGENEGENNNVNQDASEDVNESQGQPQAEEHQNNGNSQFYPREQWVNLNDFDAINREFGIDDQTSANEAEDDENEEATINSTPISLTEEEVQEAKGYRDYVENNLYNITTSDRFDEIRTDINGWVDEVENPTSIENASDAFDNLKYNYGDAKHVLNNNKIASVMEQFEGYASQDNSYEDFDYMRMSEAVETIKNEYESLTAEHENLDSGIDLVDREEQLADIFETYAVLKDNQARLQNADALNLSSEKIAKEAYNMAELEKHVHIIIENATQEGTTLEDLKLITEENNPKISYAVIKSYITRTNDYLKRNTIEQESNSQEEVDPLSHNLQAFNEQNSEQKINIVNAIEVEEETEDDSSESVEHEETEVVKTEPAQIGNSVEETKISGLLSSGERTSQNEKEANAAQMAEYATKAADNYMKQMMYERQRNAKLKEAYEQAEYRVEELTQEDLKSNIKKVCDLSKKESKTVNAAGRYTLLTIEANAAKYLSGALNKQELETRTEELKTLVKRTADDYRLYVKVENSSNVGDDKVVYYREIKEGGEKKSRSKKIIEQGPKSRATESKFSEKIREADPTKFVGDLQDDYTLQALVEDCADDYMRVMSKVIKQGEEDKKTMKQNRELAKVAIETELQNAIKNGENPFEAIDRIMGSAYKNLADKANSLQIAVLHDNDEDEM